MKKLVIFLFITASAFGQVDKYSSISDFLPEGFVIYDTVYGDLNKDGTNDCVLIIKGTDKDKIVKNRFDEEVDRNRRGIVILFKKNKAFEMVLTNKDCFSSENEDGGVYFPPQLTLNIDNANLYVKYDHGRYGHWQYLFRYANSDFELIRYDISNGGAVIESEISIDFLTKRKLEKINTNIDAEGGDEVYKETGEDITANIIIKLSEIIDLEDLDMRLY